MIAQKQKLTILVFLLAFIVVSIFTYYKVIINNNKVSKIDLTDIEHMNIGAEMPRLLYGDNKSVVMSGTFGLVIYNIRDSKVTDRLSYEQLKAYGISMLIPAVSHDGTTIYIGNDEMYHKSSFIYNYNIRARAMKKLSQQPVDMFRCTQINTPGQYDKYFDFKYLINNNIVDLDHSFVYLRANTDWSMKSLQIVICRYANGVSKVYDVF